jgi:hypothetical protein
MRIVILFLIVKLINGKKPLHMINIIQILFSYKYTSATGQRLINNKTMWIAYDI